VPGRPAPLVPSCLGLSAGAILTKAGLLGGLALVLAVATSSPVQATALNLISNGSFEEYAVLGDAPSGGFWTLDVGSPALPDWSIVQSNIDWDNGFWQAAEGTHSLDLNGNRGAGGVSQTISTEAGQTYLLTFALSGNPNLYSEYGIAGEVISHQPAINNTSTMTAGKICKPISPSLQWLSILGWLSNVLKHSDR